MRIGCEGDEREADVLRKGMLVRGEGTGIEKGMMILLWSHYWLQGAVL